MTDTKPVEGSGEATPRTCPFGCVHAFLPAVDISPDDDRYVYCTVCGACARREVWENRPIEDALTQRVKVLEEILRTTLNVLRSPIASKAGTDDIESAIEKVLAPPVGEKEVQ